MIKNGPMMLASIVAYPLIGIVVGWGFIPFIMRQHVTNAYQILEERFWRERATGGCLRCS